MHVVFGIYSAVSFSIQIDHQSLQALLKVVVVCQLLAGKDAVFTSKEAHTRLAVDSPHFDVAVRLARMIDETADGASRGIDNQAVFEDHEIIVLPSLAYLVIS